MTRNDIETFQTTLGTLEKLLKALVYGGSFSQDAVVSLLAEVKMINLLLDRELKPKTRELEAK